ncbi:MAG TPA: PQQ-dependent sugar dehydrogenase [Dehalococcoidia bacterium]|nr:PQQ-dependent sugar dehydrogenase [Dehalococcoidia bacterium]
MLAAAACGGGVDEPAPTATSAPAAPSTATAISTAAATAAPTPVPTAQAPLATATPRVPVLLGTPVPQPTATPTPTATPAATAAPTAAPTATPVATVVPAEPSIASTPPQLKFSLAFGESFFDNPVDLGPYPGDRVYVVEQGGRVLLQRPGVEGQSVLLDIRDLVLRQGFEEGLLSVTLDPAFTSNGYIYAYYSAPGPRRSVLARFTVTSDVASVASRLVIVEVAQPYQNHNGGTVRFGPDGMLYLGLGDGGSGGDPDGNGQDPSTLLGTIIRLDVSGATASQPYATPSDNPQFADSLGARPEVWAYGLRNPWRMSFDPATGSLWVGDVGQGSVEEIDIVDGGGNYGWKRLEGDRCFSPSSGCSTAGAVAPVATYTHAAGNCSVAGGVVYRGSEMPALRGYYIYGDFCSGTIWALHSDLASGPIVIAETGDSILSFGVDGDGELYMLGFGPVFRASAAD